MIARDFYTHLYICLRTPLKTHYYVDYSKLKSFIGKRIGVYSFIPFSQRFIDVSYQNLPASVPAHITTACLPNALAAWCKQLSHHITGYLLHNVITRLSSGVSSTWQFLNTGCAHFLMTSYTVYHNDVISTFATLMKYKPWKQ